MRKLKFGTMAIKLLVPHGTGCYVSTELGDLLCVMRLLTDVAIGSE